MPGPVPGIHALPCIQGVDGRDKPGHDECHLLSARRSRETDWRRAFCASLSEA